MGRLGGASGTLSGPAVWEPKVFADVTVTTIPADKEGLIAYILARPDYKDRVEAEADWLAGR